MRARSLSILAAISLASVTSFGTAHAAYDHERNGFFIGFGLGGGSDEEKYKGLDDDSGGGGVGNFRIGGALNRTFALGLETTGFTRQTDIAGGGTLQRNATVAALAATVFPTQGGYYLRGGVGFARVSAEYRDAGLTLSGDEGGLGVLFATGYEFRLTPKFALAPQFEVAGAAIDGDVVDTVSWWGLSAQLNWWW
jgi:hypothetical protein